MKRKIAE